VHSKWALSRKRTNERTSERTGERTNEQTKWATMNHGTRRRRRISARLAARNWSAAEDALSARRRGRRGRRFVTTGRFSSLGHVLPSIARVFPERVPCCEISKSPPLLAGSRRREKRTETHRALLLCTCTSRISLSLARAFRAEKPRVLPSEMAQLSSVTNPSGLCLLERSLARSSLERPDADGR